MTTELGQQLARNVAAQDADAIKSLLTPRVRFRALTPGRFWESDDADQVVDGVILGTWFPPEHSITRILKVEGGPVGIIERVGYRFQVARPDGDFVIEQQAYFKTEDNKISTLQMLCSGFVRDD
jgi:hypothetical protein